VGNQDWFQTATGIYSSAGVGSNISSVHATPSNAGTAASPAVQISWMVGTPLIGNLSVTWPANTPRPNCTSSSCIFPSLGSVTSSVRYSTVSHKAAVVNPTLYAKSAKCVPYQYLREYPASSGISKEQVFAKYNYSSFSYISAPFCHVTLTGLMPGTKYYYIVGTGSAWAAESSFMTPPNPTAKKGVYPFTVGLMADVGQTANTSMGLFNLAALNPNVVLNVGDFTYADTYGPGNFAQFANTKAVLVLSNGTNMNITQTVYEPYFKGAEVNDQRWDAMAAVPGVKKLFGSALVVSASGNHEIQASSVSTAPPFQSYAARYPSGATSAIGNITNSVFYSQNIGPVHVLVLQSYVAFAPGSAQYAFAVADLAAVNRAVTPWLIVMHHAPLYHTYVQHFKDSECFRELYEPLYFNASVDLVIAGHVHAYERTHPVYNYARNMCGPVYLTMGDGGNTEGPYRSFVDSINPATNKTFCEGGNPSYMLPPFPGDKVAKYGAVCKAGVKNSKFNPLGPGKTYGPGYQRASNPTSAVGACTNTMTFQPAQTGTAAGLVPDPNNSTGGFFCQSKQPLYSAYRDPSFGVATLTINSATSATFKWYRTIDNKVSPVSGGTAPRVVKDSITYTRHPVGHCPKGAAQPLPIIPAPVAANINC